MEKLKVIIIDDEMLIRKLIRMKMDMEGLQLELAGEYQDGADAMEHVKEVCPDIIISDIVIPRQNGFDFIHWVRENKYKVQVIFLTSYAEFDYARRVYCGGSGS